MNAIEFEDSADAGAQERLAATAGIFGRARQALTSVIFGQDEVIEQTLITLM